MEGLRFEQRCECQFNKTKTLHRTEYDGNTLCLDFLEFKKIRLNTCDFTLLLHFLHRNINVSFFQFFDTIFEVSVNSNPKYLTLSKILSALHTQPENLSAHTCTNKCKISTCSILYSPSVMNIWEKNKAIYFLAKNCFLHPFLSNLIAITKEILKY